MLSLDRRCVRPRPAVGVKLVMGPVVRTPFPAASNLFAKVTVVAKEKGLLIYLRRTLNGLLDELLTQTSLT